MAVEAQQFPIAAIGRVVVVVVVTVMNGQFIEVGARERAAAPTADPRIDLERLLSVALFAHCSSTARLGHYAVQFARVFRFHAAIQLSDLDFDFRRITHDAHPVRSDVFRRGIHHDAASLDIEVGRVPGTFDFLAADLSVGEGGPPFVRAVIINRANLEVEVYEREACPRFPR